MVLFSSDFKYKVDRGSIFYLKLCTDNNILFILQVKMADKGAALNRARKKSKIKDANTMKLELLISIPKIEK